jgi:hypothetical protein
MQSQSVWRFERDQIECAVPARSRLIVSNIESASDAARAGMGITMTPFYQVSDQIRRAHTLTPGFRALVAAPLASCTRQIVAHSSILWCLVSGRTLAICQTKSRGKNSRSAFLLWHLPQNGHPKRAPPFCPLKSNMIATDYDGHAESIHRNNLPRTSMHVEGNGRRAPVQGRHNVSRLRCFRPVY